MKKTALLITLLCIIYTTSYSQTINNDGTTKSTLFKNAQRYNGIKCKMSVHDVLKKQSFSVDGLKSEKAGKIASSLIEQLNVVYYKNQNNIYNDMNKHIESINKSIKAAKDYEMNISMFQADIDFIETIKVAK
jgi:hypothetical protein